GFQGSVYSEAAKGLEWRAPAAATAIVLFAGLWCYLDYRTPQRYGTLLDFSATDSREVNEFTAVRRKQGQDKVEEVVYTLRKTASPKREYMNAKGQPWKRGDAEGYSTEAIVDKWDDESVRYEAQLTDGKFPPNQPARYVEAGGRRYMTEDQTGRFFFFRWGLLLGNLLLNAGHLAVWFLCGWLLLRFQWSHALGLAAIFWLGMTLLIQPMLLSRTEEVARQRATAQKASRAGYLLTSSRSFQLPK